jgi:DNA repair exonuclease SbcCD ATPase subunit
MDQNKGNNKGADQKKESNQKTGLIIAVAILAVLLIIAAIWGFNQKSQNEELQSEKVELEGTIDELEVLREDLIAEVDSLQGEYSMLAETNGELQGDLAQAQETIAQKEAAIRNIKARNSSEINSLRAEIKQLMALKDELQGNIQNIQAENDSLRTAMGVLASDLDASKEEIQQLNNIRQTIEDENDRLTLENFKASAFQVEFEKGNDKVTAKAGKVKTIRTSFDLTSVPEEFQGMRTLYLTITDDKGTPIQATNPISAKTVVNNQEMDIIAVKAKDVDITKDQRLTFTYDLEEKLDPGYYRVAIYTDIGLLGASSMRLRKGGLF